VFVKILDCHILQCVLYGANFCGLKEVPEIERVHVFALKRYLNVASHTPKRRYMVKQALSLVCHHCHKSCEILAASVMMSPERRTKKACNMLVNMENTGKKNLDNLGSNLFVFKWLRSRMVISRYR